jgi:hypothetical protein
MDEVLDLFRGRFQTHHCNVVHPDCSKARDRTFDVVGVKSLLHGFDIGMGDNDANAFFTNHVDDLI